MNTHEREEERNERNESQGDTQLNVALIDLASLETEAETRRMSLTEMEEDLLLGGNSSVNTNESAAIGIINSNNGNGNGVDLQLSRHVSFTLSLLERICIGISESRVFDRSPQLVSAVTIAKHLHAERLVARDRITILAVKVSELMVKVHEACVTRDKTNVLLEKARAEVNDLKASLSTTSSSSSLSSLVTVGGEGSAVVGVTGDNSYQGKANTEVEDELRHQIRLLETQVRECEEAKAKVEMSFTERLAMPMIQSEAQVVAMRRAMEDLRLQCKQRVTLLFSEVSLKCACQFDLSDCMSIIEMKWL